MKMRSGEEKDENKAIDDERLRGGWWKTMRISGGKGWERNKMAIKKNKEKS